MSRAVDVCVQRHFLLNHRLVSVAIRRRGALHSCRVLFPGDVFFGKTGKYPEALSFRPAPLEHISEVEIVDSLRQLEAEKWMIRIRRPFFHFSGSVIGKPADRRERFEHSFQGLQRLTAQLGGRGLDVFVAVVLHFASQVLFILIERLDHEAPLAPRQHIEPPIRIALQTDSHEYGAPGVQ